MQTRPPRAVMASGQREGLQSACRHRHYLRRSRTRGAFPPPQPLYARPERRCGALKGSHLDNSTGSPSRAPSIQRWQNRYSVNPNQVQAIPRDDEGPRNWSASRKRAPEEAAFALTILNKIVTDRRPTAQRRARVL